MPKISIVNSCVGTAGAPRRSRVARQRGPCPRGGQGPRL